MSRRTRFIRPDGRLPLGADLPVDVLRRAEQIAQESGVELAVVLGDLAAMALPDLLTEMAEGAVAEGARRRLAQYLPPNAKELPASHTGLPASTSESA